MKEKVKIFINDKDIKLIDCLSSNLDGQSNKKIKSYVKYKMVEVDGKIITNANTEIKSGSTVKIYFSKRTIPEYELDIIYEDKDLIAIDKPAGLLSISNNKEKELTAYRLVSDYLKKDNKHAKVFVVHRLDQGTSGVLVFAKNQNIQEKLQTNWNDIVKKREYIAVVEGTMEKSGTIKSFLTMNHFQIVHSTNNKEIGNLAITHFKTVKTKNTYSLLEVDIDTGRRNQIRVHMSEKGHPIVGDKKYGSKKNPIGRLALHASKLHFIDPRSGKLLKIEKACPKEIIDLVK